MSHSSNNISILLFMTDRQTDRQIILFMVKIRLEVATLSTKMVKMVRNWVVKNSTVLVLVGSFA